MTEGFESKLLALYPTYTKVYGPYLRSDGRKHLVLSGGKRTIKRTLSYPKALVEVREGKILGPDETVDHVDRDFRNDDLDNLQVVDKSTHLSIDALRVLPIHVNCAGCGLSFLPSIGQRNSRANLKAGPFCSRICSGIYGKNVQIGMPKQERERISVEYYRVEKR